MKSIGLYLPFDRLVTDAANMCRWNPSEAVKWFEYARVRATEPLYVKRYNAAVKLACKTLDSIEKSRYYTKEYQDNFWGEGVNSKRPTLLEEFY